jgi:hypothetical protein
MPIQSCSNEGKPGYKWGEQGSCYTYTVGDESSIKEAKKKAQIQGIAARLNGYEEKANEVTTSSMGSGLKNPQQGYGPKKKKRKPEDVFKDIEMDDDEDEDQSILNYLKNKVLEFLM